MADPSCATHAARRLLVMIMNYDFFSNFDFYQVIVVRDVHVGVHLVEPRGVEDEFRVPDEVHHVGQLGPGGLERRGREPRQTAGQKYHLPQQPKRIIN